MPVRLALTFVALLLIVSLARAEDPPKPAPLKAGFAEHDITPEIGMEAPGGYGKAIHRNLHDPCKVRASVFSDGTKEVAIVGVDALGIRRETVQKVRQAIHDKIGLLAEHILIAASHSHSSGPLNGVMPGEYDHASPLVQQLAYKETTSIDLKYLATCEAALIDAVCAAHASLAEVKAGAGRGIEDQVAFNRRFKMTNGRTTTHPGLGNPEIIDPAGPVDPEVGVVGVWDAKDPHKCTGCIVNFACHCTTNPDGISANYVYYLEKVIQGYYGKECVVVFVAGAAGDVTQVNNRSPYQYPGGERWAELVGGRIGAEALKVLLSIEPGNLAPVDARTKVWKIKRRTSATRVEKSLAMLKENDPKVDPTERTFAKEIVLLDVIMKKTPEVEIEVQAVQVGPAVFVTNPAEYFCQYGLEIKAGSKFPFTFPVSLANGCVGYVPTEAAFGPDGGGYETRLTGYSDLEITAGNQMRDVGIELAGQLQPGPITEPPRRVPFVGKAWSYGDVPPEKE